MIGNREIYVRVTVDSDRPRGVVLAHGGDRYGYALHFGDGRPDFGVRLDGVVERLLAEDPVKGRVSIMASLTDRQLTLSVGDAKPKQIASPGLIPIEPIDALSIGYGQSHRGPHRRGVDTSWTLRKHTDLVYQR
jgi:arylsulfatase